MEERVNLEVESLTARKLAEETDLRFLVQGSSVYFMVGGDEKVQEKLLKNFSTLRKLVELENCNVYLDYGVNREKLTPILLNTAL